MMKLKQVFLSVLILMVMFIGMADVSAAPKSGGVLRVISTEAPSGSIGVPENMRGAGSKYIKGIVLEPLVIQRFKGGMEPWLAESFEWSDDYLNLTMKLRKGVKFHDGTDFNAEAVKWNWERATKGGAPGTKEVESLEIIDEYTIAFHLKEFSNVWMNHLSSSNQSQTSQMISPTAYKKNGQEWANWNPVGTGPFKFIHYEDNVSMELERFDGYWGEKPYLEGVTYTFIKEFVTAELAFEAGEGDVILAVGHDRDLMNDLMPKDKGYWAMNSPGLMSMIIPPGARANSPFSKLKVRQAVEYAIDKAKVCESIYFGLAEPKPAPFYDFQLAYDPDFKGREYNPEKARQLLAEAGYPNGFKTTLYCQFLTCGNDANAIQAYLSDVGIEAVVETMSVGKWIERETNGWEDGLLISFLGPANFRVQVDRVWVTPTKPSWTNGLYYQTMYRPKELHELTQAYFKYATQEEEREQGRKIIKVLFDNACVIPLWGQMGAVIFQPYVKHTDPEIWTVSGSFEGRKIHNFWMDK